MVVCNCGDYGLPRPGPYHGWRCATVQNSLEIMGPDEEKYYVDIPQHARPEDESFTDKRSPWPDRLQAEGAMHRLLTGYGERLVLLFRGDVVIDAKCVADEDQHYWFCKNESLYDWETGKKALFKKVD